MTSNATVAPPTSAARRYSESLSLLVDRQTRELLLGLAVLAARQGGYARPKEGEAIRELLDESIARLYERDSKLYEAAVRAGRQELAERYADTERRRTETTEMINAVAPQHE
jgi:thymidylate synthase ThyX